MTGFNVGDRGQRYEVRYTMGGRRQVFGWSANMEGAAVMCRSIVLHPSMSEPEIFDRDQQVKVEAEES